MSITIIYTHLLNFLYREQSCIRDKVYGAVGRRTVVMVFASPSANFYTGSNPRRLSGLSHLDNFIVTSKSCPSIGTVQKLMPTPTPLLRRGRLPATNPNPLAVTTNISVCDSYALAPFL
jgi:hypothetical protein